MCGIAGWMGEPPSSNGLLADLRSMCDAIRHRGPDDDGYFTAPGVALGMRRLSIIDVAGGKQPVVNEDASAYAVFNGEIYNYRQLRRRLEIAGHHLTSQSDSETLVHLYEERGEQLVHALRGMFGFALWDARHQRLLLARDRLGIKPLYYSCTPERLVFASELSAFLALEDLPWTLDRRAVGQYLALGYVPDPLSILKEVRKLPPGHLLTRDRDGRVTLARYWSPVAVAQTEISERDATQELQRLLGESVSCHLESDVPLGAFLSGGVDSSTVVAYMSRQARTPVRTFSIGFPEREFNEAPYAAEVASALGTQHTELIVRADADALVEEVVRSFDEPFGDSSALPTYLVARLAREQVTVALSGDGGDELFGGYTRYAETIGRRELRAAPLRALMRAFGHSLPYDARGRNRLLDLGRTRWGRYAATVAAAPAIADGGVALADIAQEVGPLDTVLERWTCEISERDFVTQMMLVDVQSYLPGDILTKVDRTSMAVSLEARVPLLDHEVVEFALSLPSHLTMRDGTGKWLLRKAIDGLVPRSVLERPKQGFGL
ncbi:MAG TPA: asparagine synthase (glutamine-hydrolyzing), partial [Gemmatimonadaceae bacterium]|nr:asparagine synthase (glutamine-hydrolyzing) [Gemmatimonadaceae bacterium]